MLEDLGVVVQTRSEGTPLGPGPHGGALDHRGITPDEYGYAVFGRVREGMDVVDAIEKVKTGRRGPMSDVPVEPVLIKRASVRK